MKPLQIFPRNGGITRRLARVVVLQLVFISVITVLGVIMSAKVVEGSFLRTVMEGEADYFWMSFRENPLHPMPNTNHLVGYLHAPEAGLVVPEYLLDQKGGFTRTELDGEEVLLLVESRSIHGENVTLYLISAKETISLLSFYFGVVPLMLVLSIIYLSAWVAFRHSRQAISPLVALAGHLRRFHSDPEPEVTLDLERLKSSSPDDEVNILVDSLNLFTEEINQLIQRERDFTRDVSHELRTPLAVIQGSAELLASSESLDANQQKIVRRVLRTCQDMNALIESLLLLARGSLPDPDSSQVSVNEVVDDLLEQLRITHNPDGNLDVTVDHRNRVMVQASEQLVYAICGNLLRNAFNYTRSGEVSILIDSRHLGVTNRGKVVSAMDDGRLFEPFARGKGSESVKGYGVGLDIVRKLCELYGWEVSGNFLPERGMVFNVNFAESPS